jgi:hypothetical protein
MIAIYQPSFEEILAVARNLRAVDAKELSVTRDLSNPAKLAVSAWAAKYRRMAYLDKEPTFAFGMTLFDNPTQGQVWGFGTDKAPTVTRAVTKFILTTMIPEMLDLGLLAVQAVGHPDNALSARWLRHLGFTPMAIKLPGIGAGAHDMILWITTANDHRQQHHRVAAAA